MVVPTQLFATAEATSAENKIAQLTELMAKKDAKNVAMRKKVKTLQQKVRRRNSKVSNLLDNLHQLNLIDTSLHAQLELKFSGIKLGLLQHEVKQSELGAKSPRYSDEVREFAQTLNFLSPKAYKYARKHMSLPYKSTLQRWQTVDGQPGWTAESFALLETDSQKRDCVIVMDGVHIKPSCQWSSRLRRFVGYEDFGTGSSPESGVLATEAVVFMAVGINRPWKLPLGYFLTKGGMTAEQQSSLLKEVIRRLATIGVQVGIANDN